MKAIQIIDAMVYDSTVAQSGGRFNYDGSISLRDYFGAARHTGELLYGKYFYMYTNEPDVLYDGCTHHKPDIVIYTDDSHVVVCLWRIDE